MNAVTREAAHPLPLPPPELMSSGDGDWVAIGAEFLDHFVQFGGLAVHERVLEIGCGAGRLATPLTRHLTSGSYHGVDVVAPAIGWCRQALSPLHANFRFTALDLQHPLYNPAGRLHTATTRLPFDAGSFDFICMVSVLTHLDAAELLHYAQEAARLLAPGGRCFATAFLMNPAARAALRAGTGALPFDPDARGPTVYADAAAPLAAVAYDEDFLLEKFLRCGLHRRNPASYGRWSGRAGAAFQDLCVFSRERS